MTFHTFLRACMASAFFALATQASAENHLLVPAGDRWRYLADGREPEASWRETGFRALDWELGSAATGFGDADEATAATSQRRETTYFQKVFSSPDPRIYTLLQLRLRRSDGAVVYLNGQEIARSNVPEGKVDTRTAAIVPTLGRDPGAFHNFRIPTTALRAGLNAIAVEVHPAADQTASRMSFDLELLASTAAQPAFITRGPYLQNATPEAISIRWRTDVPTAGAIRWGAVRGSLTNRANDPVALTTEHEVRITGLSAATKYFYAVRSPGAVTRGDISQHSFRTLPVPGSEVPVRAWILGDSGTGGDGSFRAEHVREAYRQFAGTRPTDVWLMLGDNAYPYGRDSDYQSAVFDTFPTFLRKTTLWSTLGNHETYAGEPIPYFNIFTLPTQGEAGGVPSGTKHYYSFDYGQVHFICLDSESSNRQPGSPMLTWLESDLAATQARWIIAYWHHPPYSHGSHNSDTEVELIEMRQYALPILESYGVDVVLCGHSHAYERSKLIDGHYGSSTTLQPSMIKDAGNGKPKGTGAYVKSTRSHAGAVYTVCGVSGQVSSGTYDHPVMVTSLATLGCMVVDVVGNRLTAKFLQSNGLIGDSFTIVKP